MDAELGEDLRADAIVAHRIATGSPGLARAQVDRARQRARLAAWSTTTTPAPASSIIRIAP